MRLNMDGDHTKNYEQPYKSLGRVSGEEFPLIIAFVMVQSHSQRRVSARTTLVTAFAIVGLHSRSCGSGQ
ncbi:hypothetical protein HAX54_002488, partial [Datura stramonium]|nr:hypothetical protein [Datura stramonium]